MPYKPKRPCSYPGCGWLTDGRYCDEHRQSIDRQYNRYLRDPDTNKRYGRAWKKIRVRFLLRHPLCEQCRSEGKLMPAEEVHHILPLASGGTNDEGNLMALCKSCHSRITIGSSNRSRAYDGDKTLRIHFTISAKARTDLITSFQETLEAY
jgi:5-methylcytosine-specific restriction protein A